MRPFATCVGAPRIGIMSGGGCGARRVSPACEWTPCRTGHPMFRRWSAPAAALAAACLLLSPQTASAQFRFGFGTGPVAVTRPIYFPSAYVAPSYRTSLLYYQGGLAYNPVVNNPFLYRDPVTPA